MKVDIKEVVIVEGKTDTCRLQSIFNVKTIETNGFSLSKKTLNLIKQVNDDVGVVLFLDPDGPGERIRQRIIDEIGSCKNAYIKKTDILNKKKIGIAEAEQQALENAFKDLVTFTKGEESISWDDYQSLQLNSKLKRKFITNYYKINECNHKRLFKHLNLLNVTFDELKDVYANFKDNS
ncbi:MAG: ribonuclease M5 [Mycoplasma sp.]